MDDLIPAAPQPTAQPPPLPYKDRSTGLKVFGILTILLGGIAGLFVPLLFFSQALAARTAATPTAAPAVMPAALVYGLTAVVFIWLGIGSVLARRWARALLLVVSWGWLILGLLSTVCICLMMPKILAQSGNGQPMPPGAIGVALAVMAVVLGVFLVIIPGIWILFYRSPQVKATCDHRDPAARWTDACPLPVLAAALFMAFSAILLLCLPLTGHAVIACFGLFLAGVPGAVVYMFLAALWFYAAWLLYRLEDRGWWLILVVLCVFAASYIFTYFVRDADEMYRAAGYPEAQIAQIRNSGLFAGRRMGWITGIASVPWLGYLLWIKRYFRREPRLLHPEANSDSGTAHTGGPDGILS